MSSGMLVREIMTPNVVTVGPDEPLRRAGELMLRHGLDALPVVDGAGKVVGMVGLKDLLAAPARVVHTGARDRYISRYTDLAAKRDVIGRLKVADMMARPVLSVSADTPVEEVIALFVNRGLHPLPVVTDGRLVGIVGRADILRVLLDSQPRDATV